MLCVCISSLCRVCRGCAVLPAVVLQHASASLRCATSLQVTIGIYVRHDLQLPGTVVTYCSLDASTNSTHLHWRANRCNTKAANKAGGHRTLHTTATKV